MFDKEMAERSMEKLEVDNDVRHLVPEERSNLVDMIDDYIKSEGWEADKNMEPDPQPSVVINIYR